jgi:hypothetical protein
MAKSIKQLIRRDIDTYGAEWIDRQPVLLGDYTATVQTGVPGVLYARQYNGKVIEVYNFANVPPTFDLHVIVGRKKTLPTTWQIIEVRETYLSPAGGGQIGYHHEQHEFPNGDTVWSDRKQILPLTVLVQDAAGFVVQVFGSVVHTATGIHKIPTQLVDLSSYVVTSGAKFVSIETDDDGVLTVNDGVAFGAPEIATDADIPVPDPGKYLIAFVLLHEGQTELADDEIRVPFPLGVIAKTSGLQIDEAAADTPLDADEFGFWDVVDSVLKKITWANIKATLKTYFDTLYAALGHSHSIPDASVIPYTPADVTDWDGDVDPGDVDNALDQLADRITTGGGAGAGGGHSHGLARWLSSGGTTFDLPDIAEYLESVSLNGLEEDPLLFSLSADRTQIVFDSATTATDVVTAHYVLAQV